MKNQKFPSPSILILGLSSRRSGLLPFPTVLFSSSHSPFLSSPFFLSFKARRSSRGSESSPAWNQHTEIDISRERKEGTGPDGGFSLRIADCKSSKNTEYVSSFIFLNPESGDIVYSQIETIYLKSSWLMRMKLLSTDGIMLTLE